MSTKSPQLLVVEDDPGLQSQLRWCFDDYQVVVCGNRIDAVSQVKRQAPDVVLLDLGLPPDPGGVSEGLATLEQILALRPEAKVIIVTGDNDRANAVRAIGAGAYDFYQKPVDHELLRLMVERASKVYALEMENRRLARTQTDSPLHDIVATSPQMLKICNDVEKVAPSDISTLLLGDSGTGKELFAQAIHKLSPRSKEKIVAINCAAIPDNLLESELFGYEKGAFTGATKQNPGKIETANGGTLFLDEIGDLPIDLQAKLLRFLQERVIERVGGREEIPVDVRIVCATHQDLQDQIKSGRFREDLYYRISEVTLHIPPLKDRDGDVLVLAKTFLNRYNDEYKKAIKGFSSSAVNALQDYAWPGNVRELESRIKRATIMADGSQITPRDLELDSLDEEALPISLREAREEAEKITIQKAITSSNGNISEAARAIDVTRPTLYALLEKYGMKP